MNAIIYLLQVSACTGIFYEFYYFMLSRLTFFTINRCYLIATLVLSFAIPLLTIPVHQISTPILQEVIYVNQLQTLPVQPVIADQSFVSTINWQTILTIGYLLGVAILFVKLILTLTAFFAKLKPQNTARIGEVSIISSNKNLNNGSFFNYIFLNDAKLSADEIRQIIEHEMLHVKLRHSADRVIVKLAQIILWFNPFIYLYARSIEENHEFEVDREIGQSNDKNKYADMLLQLSVARQGILYNSFSVVPLKKRIAMLFTKPTNHMKKVIYLLVLPVVTLSCLAFARLKNDSAVKAEMAQSDTTKKKAKPALSKIKAEKAKPALNKIDAERTKPAQLAKPAIEAKKAFLLAKPVSEPGIRIDEPFLERTRIVYADGKKKDKMIFHLADGSASAELGPDDKIGAFIDGVFFDEEALKVLPTEKARTLTTTHDGFDAKKIPDGPYAVPFAFKTKKVQKPAATPVTPKMGMQIEKQQPFFSRTPIEDSEGKHDKITFRYDDITSTTIINPDIKQALLLTVSFIRKPN